MFRLPDVEGQYRYRALEDDNVRVGQFILQ
jgi:hypothetical protein